MISKKIFGKIDPIALFLGILLSVLGLSIMYSFGGDGNVLFWKQTFSLGVAIIVYFFASSLDIYFLKNSNFIVLLYFLSVFFLVGLFFVGDAFSGAQSWFSIGLFAFQPTDLAKFTLVLILAKYFFKRHIEISRLKHLLISGIYMSIFFILLMLQPDLGSAMIVFLIWFGFILVVGIPKRFIVFLFGAGIVLSVVFYSFFLHDYQKDRIKTFLNPHLDPLGAGYNIIQANLALGSGRLVGKGFLHGSQTRMGFLPQANTDFVFSAYGEEWGFVGICILILIYIILFSRIMFMIIKGRTNFEILLGIGILLYFFTHFFVHIAINLNLLPVTGTTMPFMSYGGSHLVIEFFALGIINAISKGGRNFHRSDLEDTYIVG